MSIQIVEEVAGGVVADLTYPPCPKCGVTGVFLCQTFDTVNGFFAIVDVYACPVCQPELIAAQQGGQAEDAKRPLTGRNGKPTNVLADGTVLERVL